MIGLVLVTHGNLAEEFKNALEHVVGQQEAVETICIGPEDDMDRRREDIVNAVKDADQGNGVIILTDMFGGTPSNLALSNLSSNKVDVIGGVNLPMLIHLAQVRSDLTLQEAVQAASDAGKRYIRIGSQVMSRTK